MRLEVHAAPVTFVYSGVPRTVSVVKEASPGSGSWQVLPPSTMSIFPGFADDVRG
jgi:hypothetical protein